MKTMEATKSDSSIMEPNNDWNDSQKLIYTICARYFELCLRCTKNPDLEKAFKNPENTVAFLTNGKNNDEFVWIESNGEAWEGCGMKLPKNTRVLLDYDVAWPTLYITDRTEKRHTITIKESPLSVHAFSNNPRINEVFRENFIESGDANLELPILDEEKNNYDVTLIMPCFMPNKDMLTKVSYKHAEGDDVVQEIILTSC
jgi:hypothetical protein